MRKFLKVSLKSQWKTIMIILALVIIQTVFQMKIIDLFGWALLGVKLQEVGLLINAGSYMLLYTILSMIAIYAVSLLSTRVSSKAACTLREKIFHILMNLPDDELPGLKFQG